MVVMELLDLLRGKLENIANTLLDHQQTVWSFCFVGIVRIFVYYNFVTQLTIFLKCVSSIYVHLSMRIMIVMKIIKGAGDVCNWRLTSCCSLHAFTLVMASVQH